MIDKYKDRQGKIYIIKDMDDDHLLNAHRYFAVKRLEMQKSNEKDRATHKLYTGKDLFSISLLVNALWQEIDRRELLKY
jgi:hypothetical protein